MSASLILAWVFGTLYVVTSFLASVSMFLDDAEQRGFKLNIANILAFIITWILFPVAVIHDLIRNIKYFGHRIQFFDRIN